MNELGKEDQSIRIFNINAIILIICLIILSTNSFADSLPLLPTQTQAAEGSILRKVSNFFSNLFGGTEKAKDYVSINKELDKNLADLQQLNTNKVDSKQNESLEQDLNSGINNEPLTIPSLPEDRPKNGEGASSAVVIPKNSSSSAPKNNTQTPNTSVTGSNTPLPTNKLENKNIDNSINNSSGAASNIQPSDAKSGDANNISTQVQLPSSNRSSDSIINELEKIKNSKNVVSLSPNVDTKTSTNKDQLNNKESPKTNYTQNNTHSSSLDVDQKEYDLMQEQNKFISDEVKVLLLPEDDVVLGNLSRQANLEYMDDNEYINDFNAMQEIIEDTPGHKRVKQFIDNYQNSEYKRGFHNHPYKILSTEDASAQAFKAILNNNLSELKVLLDNYPVLQQKDQLGQNLLHLSVRLGEYPLCEYLIMRGININARDDNNNSPLSSAIDLGNNHITELLRKAGAK